MPDFVLVGSGEDKIISVLRTHISEFFGSPEFQELGEDNEVTGLVCAAFARYRRRVARSSLSGQSGQDELVACANAVEELSKDRNLLIQNYVVTEILENLPALDEESPVLEHIQAAMGVETRRLVATWLER